MVDLGIGLHGDLPVAVQIEDVARRQPALVELKLLPLLGHRAEPLAQGRGVIVEVDEDQVAEALAADLGQAPAAVVQAAEILGVAQGHQIAVVAVAPAVVFDRSAAAACRRGP